MPWRMVRSLVSLAAISEPDAGDSAADLPVTANEASPLSRLMLHLRTDEELVAELIDGEPDALTVLFSRHSPLVFRVARRILRNDAEAEDDVQHVFLDIFRSARQFDSRKGSFKSWLLMFAYHRTFNRLRTLRGNGYYDPARVADEGPDLREGVGSLPYSSGDVSILIDQVLRMIQPRQRRALELTYFEGLTAAEASQVTGESVRVVRHNIYRGLKSHRRMLGRTNPERDRRDRRLGGFRP